jgi:tellurite resistance protein
MQRLGLPEATVQEVERFDFKGGKIEDLLPGIKKGGLRARMLLRDAIELSRADGHYAAAEKEAVAKVAKLLGVDQATVKSIEALVELEHAARHLRKALFPKKKRA